MQKITTHLWFDKEAKDAAEFYASVFKQVSVKNISTIHDTPSGTVDIVTVDILGSDFTFISADPAAEQCGWLKDKFGFSWQIVPTKMNQLLSGNDTEKIARVTKAFLKMKKFVIEDLEKA